MKTRFSLEEFKTLCFDIGINYDLVRGEQLEAKAVDLVLALERGSQLEVLIDEIKSLRPDAL